MKKEKIQKNLNLSRIAVDTYLPALRRVHGTYATAVEVALARLYHEEVVAPPRVEERLQHAEAAVRASLEGEVPVQVVEFRYAPGQSYDKLPRWTYVHLASSRDALLGQSLLEALTGGVVFTEPRDTSDLYYLALETQELLAGWSQEDPELAET